MQYNVYLRLLFTINPIRNSIYRRLDYLIFLLNKFNYFVVSEVCICIPITPCIGVAFKSVIYARVNIWLKIFLSLFRYGMQLANLRAKSISFLRTYLEISRLPYCGVNAPITLELYLQHIFTLAVDQKTLRIKITPYNVV